MKLIPDWNSLDSVRHAHSELEAAALIFFALLVIFDVLAHISESKKEKERLLEKIGLCFFAVAVISEIIAYPYGQRNDELSAQIIGSLDLKAEAADSKAQSALAKAVTADRNADDAVGKSGKAETASSGAISLARGARKEADSFEREIVSAKESAAKAEARASQATQKVADRFLTPEQQVQIGDKLRPFGNQKVEILVVGNTMEIDRLASGIRASVTLAGWTIGNDGRSVFGVSASGVTVSTHEGSGNTINAAASLLAGLIEAGISSVKGPQYGDRQPGAISGISRDWNPNDVAPIRIVIGSKP